MPKLSRLHCIGRLKALHSCIHSLQLELDEFGDEMIYEHHIEFVQLRDKLMRQRKEFAAKHEDDL